MGSISGFTWLNLPGTARVITRMGLGQVYFIFDIQMNMGSNTANAIP